MDKLTPTAPRLTHDDLTTREKNLVAYVLREIAYYREPQSRLDRATQLNEEAARREGEQKPENDGHNFDAVCKKCGFTHAGSTEREGLGSAAPRPRMGNLG